MSAIGSVIYLIAPLLESVGNKFLIYQLDFLTPGILPKLASSLKHNLHILNFLKNALGLPHKGQRLLALTLNFGSLIDFSISAFRVITPFSLNLQ
jgi:hypothetical protein